MRSRPWEQSLIEVGDVRINTNVCGSGPPVLLLHGYPQTHLMWDDVAEALSDSRTVVATDLRGYGDSDKPPGDPEHVRHSKRAMATDQVAVMEELGYDSFALIGHDRGARVAHRLAIDHPDRVRRLAVIDIAPTHEMFTTADLEFGMAYYHWFFLAQPADFPERLIGADPGYFVRSQLDRWSAPGFAFDEEVLAEYVRCFSDPAAIHASCEDYRAAATIDLAHDEADLADRLPMPVLCLWGEKGFVGSRYDVVRSWERRAADVTGAVIPSGHFVPEEAPEATARALSDFARGEG